MVSDFHGSVHQRGDADDMGFGCFVDLHKSYELGNITGNVANATKIHMIGSMNILHVDANPLFSSLSSDELPHMLNCLQATEVLC